MKTIFYKMIIMLLILLFSLTGCSGTDAEAVNTEHASEPVELTSERDTETANEKRNDIVIGQWGVGGVFSNEKLIDISTVDALKDLYDGTYLTVSDDGTFVMINSIFVGEGDWEEIDTEDYEHAYVLSEHQSYRYTFQNGKLEQTDLKVSDKQYIMCITNEDENSALVMEQSDDEEKESSSLKVWVRAEADSKYLSLYATPVDNGKKAEDESRKPVEVPAQTAVAKTKSNGNTTSGMRNALEKAYDYLEFMPFSAVGLKEQLEYEGFSSSDAQYAVDNCGADWKQQAKLKAQDYLDSMSFSYDGLVEQLEYEGFTHEEAVYGVDQVY